MINIDAIAFKIAVTYSNDDTQIGTRLAEAIVSDVFSQIKNALKNGESVKIHHFGVFSVYRAQARSGRNPRSGATINIPPRNHPSFRPYAKFRQSVR